MLSYFVIALYVVGLLLYFQAHLGRQQTLVQISGYVVLTNGLFHLFDIIKQLLSQSSIPSTLGFFAYFSAFILTVGFLVSHFKFRQSKAALVILPAIVMLCVSVLGSSSPSGETWHHPIIPFHVFGSMIGNIYYVLAFFMGLVYLAQSQKLKHKRTRLGQPSVFPLELIDQLVYSFLVKGFVFLTFGLGLGVIWLYISQHVLWNWEPKLVFSTLTWLCYVMILFFRSAFGWRGRRSILLSTVLFFFVLATFMSINRFIQY